MFDWRFIEQDVSSERWWEDVRPEMKTPRRDAFPVILRWGGAARREGKRGSRPESRVGDVPVTIRIVSNNSTLQESSWTIYSYLGHDSRGTYVIGNGTIRIISFVPILNGYFAEVNLSLFFYLFLFLFKLLWSCHLRGLSSRLELCWDLIS